MTMGILPPKKRLVRFSFKNKLFLSYILIVLIPVSISAVWIYGQVIGPLQGERLALAEQATAQVQAAVNAQIDTIENTGYLISTNIVLKKALLKRYYDQAELIEVMNTSIQSLLSWFEATQSEVGDFRFFTVNETLPESNFFIPGSRFAAERWFTDMQKKIVDIYPYWEPWHTERAYPYSRQTGQPVYSMFYPINEDFPGETSYLEFEIPVRHFFAKPHAGNASKSGFILAADWQNQVVYAPADQAETAEGIALRDEFRGLDLSIAQTGALAYGGEGYRYVVKPVERLHTSLVLLVPAAEIDGPWMKTKTIFQLLILFLAVLLAGLSYLLSGLLIKKIIRIGTHVRKLQNGNFEAQIPVKGEDEIDWLAIHVNAMTSQIHELINRVYRAQVAEKEAELMALQAQINPHFLFNTLETLRMMAEMRDQPELSDGLTALGSIMRYNIVGGRQATTLALELEHIADYMEIQNLLHNNRISLTTSVPTELLGVSVPNLLLQPLVENCIVHGMKEHNGTLVIDIRVEALAAGNGVRITVADNGSGIAAERLAWLRKQLALPADHRHPPVEGARGAGRAGADGASTAGTGGVGADDEVEAVNGEHGGTLAIDGTLSLGVSTPLDAVLTGANAPLGAIAPSVPPRQSGIGLFNSNDRIRYYFQPGSGMELDSEEGVGTTVILTLVTK
jgi:two-component system sensor histidine kinase YesM